MPVKVSVMRKGKKMTSVVDNEFNSAIVREGFWIPGGTRADQVRPGDLTMTGLKGKRRDVIMAMREGEILELIPILSVRRVEEKE